MVKIRRYYVANYRKGWRNRSTEDSLRHSLAAKGIATGRSAPVRSSGYSDAYAQLNEFRARRASSPTRAIVSDVGQTEEVVRAVEPLRPTAELPVEEEQLTAIPGREERVTVEEPDIDIEETVDTSEPEPLGLLPGARTGMKVMTPGVPPPPSGIGEESAVIKL